MNATRLRCHIDGSDRTAVESITASSGFFSPQEVKLAVSVFKEAIASPETSYHFVMAEEDDVVVGYACWGKDEQTDDSYELYWIAVDNDCRGSGIGSLLLEAVETAIGEAAPGRLYIETAGRAQYESTRRFYEQHGYRQVAWLEDYFAPGHARVIYMKQL